MEEIEYLEEYEDFILPNEAKCTEKLSADRSSVDSLEGLYKDLIGDSSVAFPGKTNVTQYTAKPSVNTDKISLNTVDTGLLAKPLQIPKCNVNSGSTAFINKTNTSEIQQQLYKCQTSNISFINRTANKSFSTCSALQRTDKLKSVATVKPTLQRVNTPAKQCMISNTPPLKNTTVEKSYHPYPVISSTASTESKNTFGSKVAVNNSKINVQSKNIIKTSIQFPGSGVDPLSLEDHEAFLDFDVDKNGSVDDFDFESDLDNSITAGISDMDSDSVDLSDDYSDGNFDLESDLSSDASDVKRTMLLKGKRLQESNLEENAEKINKPEPKRDQTNLKSKIKRSQHFNAQAGTQYIAQKIFDPEKRPSHSSFGERNIHAPVRKSQFIGRKESFVKSLTSKNKEGSFNDKLSRLPKQLQTDPNDCLEKISNVVSNPKRTAVVPHCKKVIVIKKDECDKNHTLKPGSATTPEKNGSAKYENNKTTANVDKIKNKDESLNLKSIEPPSDDTMKKTISEPRLYKSLSPQHRTEHSNHKDAETPDKNVRIKFGPLYLKSIKPPICKGLMEKKISPKFNIPSVKPQLEQIRQLVTPQPTKKHIANEDTVRDKNISQKTFPEKKAFIPPCEGNKTCSYDSKSVQSNILKKDFSRRKSPAKNEDDRSYRKSKEIEESDSNDKSQRNPIKPQKYSDGVGKQVSDEIIEKRGTSDQNDLKENKAIVQSSNCSLDKLSDNITNENNSLKERAPKRTENTVDSKKTSKLHCKFKPRGFDIRLNKNTIAQFARTSTGRMKFKGSTTLQDLEHGSENTLIQKMLAPPNVDASSANTVSESGKDVQPEAQEISKKTSTSTEISSNILEKETEVQTKDAEGTNKKIEQTSRKRKNGNMNAPSKILRSSLKPLPEIPDIINHDTSKSATTLINSNSEVKERNLKESAKILTDAVSRDGLSVVSNSNSNAIKKIKKRARRPFSRKKRKTALAKKSKDISRSNNVSDLSVLVSPKKNSCNREKEQTPPIQTSAVLIDEYIRNENIVPSSSERTDINKSSEIEIIQPKRELYGDTVFVQYQPGTANRDMLAESIKSCGKKNNCDGCHKTHLFPRQHEASRSNQLLLDACTNALKSCNTTHTSDCRNDTEFTVFELPSYIVMKTKIITRKDLHSSKTSYIPPIVKQKIDKLAEERQAIPFFKMERPEFKDICLEINTLLGRNANYLKFASGSERQTRMNQVLADSSLSVDDAQCALKFLQSYLSFRTKDTSVKSKGQQFIPIYDSQKKIIGYRKRTVHTKKSSQTLDNTKGAVLDKLSNLNAPTSSSVAIITNPETLNVHTVAGTSSGEQAVQFSTKKEPQSVDAGEEEIIVPDAAPAVEPRIKNEAENMKEVI